MWTTTNKLKFTEGDEISLKDQETKSKYNWHHHSCRKIARMQTKSCEGQAQVEGLGYIKHEPNSSQQIIGSQGK
jgi:hypothetical protein